MFIFVIKYFDAIPVSLSMRTVKVYQNKLTKCTENAKHTLENTLNIDLD